MISLWYPPGIMGGKKTSKSLCAFQKTPDFRLGMVLCMLKKNLKILKNRGYGSQYFTISTIVSAYAEFTNKFQRQLVVWIGFDFLEFWQIDAVRFFFFFLTGPLTN